ncbi:MAG: N-acetylmuramoyl-L-alanine amidase [Deltaproteobacteria bacterium]|nr:N-acetylmuramoyl-L-alanine amidase [Deltaproteobacteria bacterium]
MNTPRFTGWKIFVTSVALGSIVLGLANDTAIARQARKRLDGIAQPQKDTASKASTAEAEGGKALLTQIRHTSSDNYTRVTMKLSAGIRYESHLLKEDPAKDLPPRIYFDLIGARLAMDSRPILVQDGLLRQVRVGQFGPKVVRVVLDMTSFSDHKAFLLPDPYRLVIDIQGRRNGGGIPVVAKKKELPLSPPARKAPPEGIRKIVLDPGHGGKDPGAIGIGGVAEKDIVLSVARKLAKKLKREMGIDVVLTRQDDTFVPLEDRTAIANAEEADLFISLHTNASPNPEARGIETYYLDNTNDEASIRLAARENATSRKNISDLQFILSDLTQNMKLEDSITLAHRVHSSVVGLVGQKRAEVKDLGVKKALFYVLVGARMPSILVELFFVTHKNEGRQLGQASHQEMLVDALFDGIRKYQETTLVVKNL